MNNRNLSHELQNLINPEPTFEDPEDGENIDSSDKWFSSRPAAENGDEIQTPVVSKIRKKQVSFLSSLDKRYVGKKISRTNLTNDDEESELTDENVNSDSESSQNDEFDGSKIDDEEEEDIEEDLSESDFDEEDQMSDDELEDSNRTLKSSNGVFHDDDDDNINILNFDADKQMSKASAVKNQLLIYDNLLEARIKMQKLLLSANRLPQNQNLTAVKSAKSVLLTELINECAKGARKLGKLLLELDTFLEMNNEEDKAEQTGSKPAERKRPKSTDFEEASLSKRFCTLASQYRPVIENWHERTKFVNANTKLKKFESFDVCPTKSIDQILTDKKRLISRTRIKRSAIKIIGQSENSEVSEDDPNSSLILDIYDDDDFYHQLLRQIIENKMGNVDDSTAMSKKYMEIQRMRNKLKKQVDTRASKGRKIRYDVHEKLVNFMAPVDRTSMTEEAKSELFKSLFGNFSANID